MEGDVQLKTPQSTKTCGSLDVRVTALLLTLAGVVILVLLYRLLQLRHRLKVASARHALQYHGFYRTATYVLAQDLPLKNGAVCGATVPVQTVTTITPLPLEHGPSLPLLPPPPLRPPPTLPENPPVLPLPHPRPVIHPTPPSPQLSWGACSDVVYSRIGTFRASRLSSLSNQSKVILFEHSSF